MNKISLAAMLAATVLASPVLAQSSQPSSQPSSEASQPSSQPSELPSSEPSELPSSEPSELPSSEPSSQPSEPSEEPSSEPASSSEPPADDDGFRFDIDVSLNISFSFQQTIEFRNFILESNVTPVDDATVDLDVTVGSTIPNTVSLAPLPDRLVVLYPQFKGFLFFVLADGRIVVVNPTTLKIVLIIYAD